MSHTVYMVRITLLSLVASFTMLALAAGVPPWLVLTGACWWVAASFLGVLVGRLIAFGRSNE